MTKMMFSETTITPNCIYNHVRSKYFDFDFHSALGVLGERLKVQSLILSFPTP